MEVWVAVCSDLLALVVLRHRPEASHQSAMACQVEYNRPAADRFAPNPSHAPRLADDLGVAHTELLVAAPALPTPEMDLDYAFVGVSS